MGRKLDGIVDGYKMGFIRRDKMKRDMRSRYYTLLETNSEYQKYCQIGATLAGVTIMTGIILASVGFYAGLSQMVYHLSK